MGRQIGKASGETILGVVTSMLEHEECKFVNVDRSYREDCRSSEAERGTATLVKVSHSTHANN